MDSNAVIISSAEVIHQARIVHITSLRQFLFEAGVYAFRSSPCSLGAKLRVTGVPSGPDSLPEMEHWHRATPEKSSAPLPHLQL